MKEQVMEELKSAFRPEFLNRIDDIIVFHKLDEANIRDIARLRLGSVAARLQERSIALQYTDEAVEHLAKVGFDDAYGARPLRRMIQQTVEDKLSEEILAGHVSFGSQVEMYMDEGEIRFRMV